MDLQNYFISSILGRPSDSVSLKGVDKLVEQVISSCRKAGILIVWLGWGLTEQEVDEMPPSIARGYQFGLDTNFDEPKDLGPLGADIGPLKLVDGAVIEAGRVMMRDQWNTVFYPALAQASNP